MEANSQTTERKISVSVSVRGGSLTKQQADELEDRIRDVCDDYEGVDVLVTRGAERTVGRA